MNSIAVDVATRFTKSIIKGQTVGYSLYNAQKEFIREKGYTFYLLHGYIFSQPKQTKPQNKSLRVFLKKLHREIGAWEEYSVKTDIDEAKENSIRIIAFLKKQKGMIRV